MEVHLQNGDIIPMKLEVPHGLLGEKVIAFAMDVDDDNIGCASFMVSKRINGERVELLD
jgi:hypothetical protein